MNTIHSALHKANLIDKQTMIIVDNTKEKIKRINNQLNLYYNNPLKFENKISNLEIILNNLQKF